MKAHSKPDFDSRWELNEETGCWLWNGRLAGSKGPRPVFGRINGKKAYASIWIYTHEYGSVLPGMEIGHLCHNRLCVNPDHLIMLTQKQNQAMERILRCNACGVGSMIIDTEPRQVGRMNAGCSCSNGRCTECRTLTCGGQ